MQPKTSQATGRSLLLAIPTLTLAGTLLVFGTLLLAGTLSCGKKTAAVPNTPMDQAAKILQGEKRSGSLIGAEDADRLALSYNNGRQYILVDKLPGMANIGVFSATSAEMITSEYGIVIKDLSDNRLVMLANSDGESVRRMEQARALLKEGPAASVVFGTIFGTTIVNPG